MFTVNTLEAHVGLPLHKDDVFSPSSLPFLLFSLLSGFCFVLFLVAFNICSFFLLNAFGSATLILCKLDFYLGK